MTITKDKSKLQGQLQAAQFALRSRDFVTAEKELSQALKTARQSFGESSSHTAVILSELAECYEAQGKETEADECYRQVRNILTHRRTRRASQ